jgi:hypothetical protein
LYLCCVSRYSGGVGWLAGLPLPIHSVGIHGCLLVGGGCISYIRFDPSLCGQLTSTPILECPHSIRGGRGSIPGRCSSIFCIWREVLGHKHTHIMYRFHSSMVEHPHSFRGGPRFDSRMMQFNIWHLERRTRT